MNKLLLIIVMNMSQYYLFLCRMNCNIRTDEDLVVYIRNIVQERALTYIASLNKPT